MRNEHQWTIQLLSDHQHLLHQVLYRNVYLGLLPLVHQAAQQAFGMVNYLRRRLPKRRIGIVAKGHDASIGNLQREEVFQPERLRFWVCPGGDRASAESMYRHDTEARLWLVK